MKTIVTHYNPDLDAITAVWLVKKFLKGWEDAELAFVPAGKTLGEKPPDEDPEIIHVDTGLGKFDHHDTDEDVCAAGLVWEEVRRVTSYELRVKDKHFEEAVERLVKVVNEIDHFREVYWPKPDADYYDFNLERILDGWKLLYPGEYLRFVEWGRDCLDGILITFKNKIWAEEEMEKGKIFETKWGKALAVETVNDETIHLAQKKDFVLVARKDPRKGYLRIKAKPDLENDLTAVCEELKEKDPKATWFLHASKHMILNGSAKNPESKPTKLSLDEVVEIIQNNV